MAARANDVAIVTHNLHKHYGNVRTVDGIDREIARGECFGLSGPGSVLGHDIDANRASISPTHHAGL